MAISRREIVSFTLCFSATRTQDGYDFFSIFLYATERLCLCMRACATFGCGEANEGYSSNPRVFLRTEFFFVLLWPVSLCADFKSYPKTIPTEIIYCRLSLTTQRKRWYATALHNSLYTFLRVKQAIYMWPLLCFRFSVLCRHLFWRTKKKYK